MSLVARLGLGLSLVIGAILVAAPLQLASKSATGTMTVTATVRPSCLITTTSSTPPSYVRISCPSSTGPFRIYNTANVTSVVF